MPPRISLAKIFIDTQFRVFANKTVHVWYCEYQCTSMSESKNSILVASISKFYHCPHTTTSIWFWVNSFKWVENLERLKISLFVKDLNQCLKGKPVWAPVVSYHESWEHLKSDTDRVTSFSITPGTTRSPGHRNLHSNVWYLWDCLCRADSCIEVQLEQ